MSYFSTEIVEYDGILSGPVRSPTQLLQHQALDGGASIHDDAVAGALGFRGGTIEGPIHFSQFEPVAERVWGDAWFVSGCVSAHFRAPAYEGDRLRAFLRRPDRAEDAAEIWLLRDDGTEILRGTASVGADAATALDRRLAAAAPLADPVIHADLAIGAATGRVAVSMSLDDPMGDLYPFTLGQKLAGITEAAAVHLSADGPWPGRVVPLEMVSVLVQSVNRPEDFPRRRPAVGLFADMEVRLLAGPVLAGRRYEVSRELVFVSGSRRTESMWVRSRLWDAGTDDLVAEVLLNEATFKDSYPRYAADHAALWGTVPGGGQTG